MNWQSFARALGRSAGRYQPRLDVLEDRTLLTTTTFTLLPSSLSIAGSRIVYGSAQVPINEQAPGSFTTTYEGAITTDIDPVGHTLTFLNDGGALTADNSGNWQPGVGGSSGSAPANYGGQFQFLGTNYAAIRDLVIGLTADPVPLTRSGGDPQNGVGVFSFPSTQTVTLANGNFDFRTTLFGNDSESAAGLYGSNQAANGTVQVNGDGTLTLTVPVDADILVYDLGNGDGAWIHFNGTLTGIGSLGTGPAVGSFRIAGASATAGSQLTESPIQPTEPASPSLSSAGDVSVLRSQLAEGRSGDPYVPRTHHAGTLALDAVLEAPF